MVIAKVLSGFLFFSGTFAYADAPRSVLVSGSCIRSTIPDRGVVTLTAEAKDPSSKRAQIAATQLYESVRSKVTSLRLPDADLSTAEYTSEELKEWEKNRMVSKGFRTRIALRVETSDHSRLGEVLEVGTREGVTEMTGLQLFVSSKKMLDEKMFCLKDAAEQARAKADTLAKTLGAKLGEVLTIQETGSTHQPPAPRPMMMKSAQSMNAAEAAPTLEAGKVEVSTEVQVTFALK